MEGEGWQIIFLFFTNEDLNPEFFRRCTNKGPWYLLIECIKYTLILVLKLRWVVKDEEVLSS
jgi:hypothetical protein